MTPRTLAIAAATLLASVASPQSPTGLPEREKPKAGNAKLVPGSLELFQEHQNLFKLAVKAEARGDFLLAESLYQQWTTLLGSDFAGDHLPLAQLYDKQGKELQALREYRIVVHGFDGKDRSTYKRHVVLMRYGALCEKRGLFTEAAGAYTLALKPKGDLRERRPNPVPRDGTFGALKAAAYTALAISLGSHGDFEGRTRALEVSVNLDPRNWVSRFYRARDFKDRGRLAEARREADLAARFAPPEMQGIVSKMKREERIDTPTD